MHMSRSVVVCGVDAHALHAFRLSGAGKPGSCGGQQRICMLDANCVHSRPAVVKSQVRAPGRAAKYRLRTAQLRKWVEQKSPAAGFIDFDSLSLAPNGPPNTKSDKCVGIHDPDKGGSAATQLSNPLAAVFCCSASSILSTAIQPALQCECKLPP